MDDLSLNVDLRRVLLNLGVAFVLGAFISYRPWRFLLGMSRPQREMVHAQILICVAGAIAVTVIGDSLARAFGLVGLGGFIRFRTGIRDPRDAAVFFVLIGLGMACGLGAIGIAVLCAIFAAVVALILDFAVRGKERPYLRLTVVATEPLAAEKVTRSAILAFPLTIKSTKIDQFEVRFELENPKGIEASEIQTAIYTQAQHVVRSLECERLDTLKGTPA